MRVDAARYGRLQARAELLEQRLRTLVSRASEVLPDMAPFDMQERYWKLWQAIEDASRELTRKRTRPADVEDEEEPAWE